VLLQWDGRDDHGVSAVPGTYLVRLHVGDTMVTRKVLRIR
jgi:hypothetical protein